MNSLKLWKILFYAKFRDEKANLSSVNLNNADLSNANLSGVNLSYADLNRANLNRANLGNAKLSYVNLVDADLRFANLCGADLRFANLCGANLCNADLRSADLRGVDLSRSIGLIKPHEYLKDNFEYVDEGLIVYKSFDDHYAPNKNWNITKGSVIEEICNYDRAISCACGINVGTLKWCNPNCFNRIWKCLIEYKWLSSVCVPYNSNGKIRCGKLKLLHIIT